MIILVVSIIIIGILVVVQLTLKSNKNASSEKVQTEKLVINIGNYEKIDFVAVDFETAQGPRWSICQVGLAIIVDGEIKETLCYYVRPPENKYMPGNIRVHKITPEKTENKPHFPEIWDYIKHLFENNLVVAHNSDFDVDCLYKTLDYYGLEIPKLNIDCTFKKTGLKLEEACAAFKIDLSEHHNAECDAKGCAQIYLHIINGTEPDYSSIPISKKIKFNRFNAHSRIKGDILKPDLVNADNENPFYSKKVVFTGVLANIERNTAAIAVKKMGADIDTGVTKRTNFVIVGYEPGPSKMSKVDRYNMEGSNIIVIYEEEFLKMIN